METAVETRRHQRVRGWWPDLLLLAGFVLLTVALARGHLLALDVRVADWVSTHRPAPLYWTLRVLNYLGQGGQVLMPVAILLAGLGAWRLRSVRPLVLFGGAFVLTYVTIGPLKIWLDRAAPAFKGPDREILFNPAASGAEAMSYPSGHVANALAWYFVIVLLLAPVLRRPLSDRARLALRVAPPVIVFITTTYLAFHWITDSVAGLLLGLILVRLLARVPWGIGSRSTSRPASPA
ncbi:phosphatase PAP2 family protein [Pseudosporangium ferrugineum]|uniref:PAP2 superfamily protein n=1 Tax=Pseudosporangium ferrugineum TaxID=439699 RepID=A0A2T0S5Y6_9ACTN|nr:phosphatase PAP2 family protein [Pseudosporangium ferrugineum]PRY28820.1 PAP2 superfamily protein [Pseudosporangium ferrugineum]